MIAESASTDGSSSVLLHFSAPHFAEFCLLGDLRHLGMWERDAVSRIPPVASIHYKSMSYESLAPLFLDCATTGLITWAYKVRWNSGWSGRSE